MPELPPRPDLDQLRRQARDLLRAARAGDAGALTRIAVEPRRLSLTSAQHALAREYGFAGWAALKLEVETRNALDSGDLRGLARLLAEDPGLATAAMRRWSDHPAGVTPLGYVAMLRFDTGRREWRDVTGTGTVARLLLAAGAPVDGRPGDAEPPLVTAASYGDAEVARVLIDAGADLEAVAAAGSGGVPGGTALLHAAVFGMTAVVDVLVAAGARVGSLEEAAAAGEVCPWLDPSPPLDARVRALVMAADHQRLAVLDALVAAGTPVDAVDPAYDRHPLRTAAAHGRPRSVARLLSLGADPDLRDPQGRTALELCRRGRAEVADPAGHERVEELLRPVTTA